MSAAGVKLRDRVTMANPESRADVRLDALSLARLRYSFLHDSACRECSFRLMLRPESNSLFRRFLFRTTTQTDVQHPNRVRSKKIPSSWRNCGRDFFFLPPPPVNGVLCKLHLTLPISLRAVKGISAICVCKFKFSLSYHQRWLQRTFIAAHM